MRGKDSSELLKRADINDKRLVYGLCRRRRRRRRRGSGLCRGVCRTGRRRRCRGRSGRLALLLLGCLAARGCGGWGGGGVWLAASEDRQDGEIVARDGEIVVVVLVEANEQVEVLLLRDEERGNGVGEEEGEDGTGEEGKDDCRRSSLLGDMVCACADVAATRRGQKGGEGRGRQCALE